MEVNARVGPESRVQLPPDVIEALDLAEGDTVLFRIDGERVTLSRIPNLLELAGSFEIPEDKRGVPWDEIRRETWRRVAHKRVTGRYPDDVDDIDDADDAHSSARMA